MMPSSTKHLVAVWNPATAEDAMEAHLELLLELMTRYRRGEVGEDEVYVWWGKIRSSNRMQPLAHLQDILRLDAEQLGGFTEDGVVEREVHLYLTDYRSLYVAHVGEITADDVRQEDDDPTAHIPSMYQPDVNCDCWFRLFDVRRVVHDDTLQVVQELRKLRNTRYHDKPVSLYGGMHELPLIVTRPDGVRWFDPITRERLTDGRFWAEVDSELSGVGEIMASLRQDVLGEETWELLVPAARLFIASAEKLYRDHRTDPAFDFSPVVVNLCKAYESHLAEAFGAVQHRLPDDAWHVNVDGVSRHLVDDGPFTIGQLSHALRNDQSLLLALGGVLGNGHWVKSSLPHILLELAKHRNPGAHTERIPREVARRLRNQHMGIGSAGALVELAKVIG